MTTAKMHRERVFETIAPLTEPVDLPLTFPENYGSEELAGADAEAADRRR